LTGGERSLQLPEGAAPPRLPPRQACRRHGGMFSRGRRCVTIRVA
jgi:hypothetical protein